MTDEDIELYIIPPLLLLALEALLLNLDQWDAEDALLPIEEDLTDKDMIRVNIVDPTRALPAHEVMGVEEVDDLAVDHGGRSSKRKHLGRDTVLEKGHKN